MTDLHTRLDALRRPRTLIRAARFGLAEYRRTPALRAQFAAVGARTAPQIVSLLLSREADLDSRRRTGDSGYSAARHVELLIALMAEAQLLRATASADQPKASGISALRLATKSSSAARTPSSRAGAW